MRHQRLDLNLLAALRALLVERNVTRVAQQMHLSQSAMSGILSRLREHFDDPLIVPLGRRMALTPLAESLVGPVGDLLMRIDATLGTRPEFDPATSRRRFSLVTSDYVTSVLMLQVLRRMRREAPGVALELRPTATNLAAQLENGDLDLLITPDAFASSTQATARLFEDAYCALVAREHPDVGDALPLAQYLKMQHVAFSNHGKPFFEAWLARTHGEQREVVVSTHHFTLLPAFVAGTALVATVHARLAAQLPTDAPVRAVPLAFEVPRLVEVLQWHTLRDADPGCRWLRALILEEAAQLPPA